MGLIDPSIRESIVAFLERSEEWETCLLTTHLAGSRSEAREDGDVAYLGRWSSPLELIPSSKRNDRCTKKQTPK